MFSIDVINSTRNGTIHLPITFGACVYVYCDLATTYSVVQKHNDQATSGMFT